METMASVAAASAEGSSSGSSCRLLDEPIRRCATSIEYRASCIVNDMQHLNDVHVCSDRQSWLILTTKKMKLLTDAVNR